MSLLSYIVLFIVILQFIISIKADFAEDDKKKYLLSLLNKIEDKLDAETLDSISSMIQTNTENVMVETMEFIANNPKMGIPDTIINLIQDPKVFHHIMSNPEIYQDFKTAIQMIKDGNYVNPLLYTIATQPDKFRIFQDIFKKYIKNE